MVHTVYFHFSILFLFLLLVTNCKQNKATAELSARYFQAGASLRILSSGFVFSDNQTFAQCHASTLVQTNDGKFLVAWFGGTSEGNNDVAIWLSKGTQEEWTSPVKIAKINDLPHWNPVLFKTPSGDIFLFFKVGSSPAEWSTWYKISKDNGDSWSDARELVHGDKLARGPVRNKPIILSDGSWIAGSSDEKNGVWNVFADRSTDQGKSWTATSFFRVNRDSITGRGVIQPTLWESAPGQVHMMMRSTGGFICRSDSKDYGKTWSAVYKTSLPNNNSGIDVTKLDDVDGTLVLVFNNLRTDGIRTPINAAVSKDNGKTWPAVITLENTPGSEFSYPAIISVGKKVYGTYTWKRSRIAFWVGELTKQ